MFQIKLVLIFLWLVVSASLALVRALPRWGNLESGVWWARLFSKGAWKISGMRVVVDNVEGLHATGGPCIYVCNHQGSLDLATVGSFYPLNTVVIGKKEIIWVPIFGWLFVAAGNVRIDRGNRHKAISGLDRALDEIVARKHSVLVFPEGTRNRTGDSILPFKKGAFHMAIKSGMPIVPIVSSPLRPIVDAPRKHMVPGTVHMKVLAPIDSREFASVDALLEETQRRMLEAYRGLRTVVGRA